MPKEVTCGHYRGQQFRLGTARMTQYREFSMKYHWQVVASDRIGGHEVDLERFQHIDEAQAFAKRLND